VPEQIEAGPFQFREVTRSTGVDVRHDRSVFSDDGSGVAVGDLDGDGDDDLVFTQGLLRPLAVYRNDRRLRFALVQQDPVAGAGGTALALGDLDLDGDLDLAVAGRGRLDLMENVGDLSFRSRTPGTGLAIATSMGSVGIGTGALVADLDLDGMLDVAVVSRLGPEVFRNRGGWRFQPASIPLGMPTTEYGLARALAYADFTADGLPDLFVGLDTDAVSFDAADLPSSPRGDLLLRAQRDPSGGVRFVDESAARGVGGARSSMGVLVSDLDDDGHLDVLLSNIGAKALLLGRGAAPFVASMTHDALAAPRRGTEKCALRGRDRMCLSYSWGLALADGDGDGDEDLFVANGALAAPEPLGIFERGPGGSWRARAHQGARTRGFALVAADLDEDGDADLIQTPFNGSAVILENRPPRPIRSARVSLRGRRNNPHGVGALVTAVAPDGRRTTWPVGAGGSPYGSPSLDVTIPLGDAPSVDFIVRWPDGTEQRVEDVGPGRVEVIEASSEGLDS